ncbi:MAG: hypothetical protein NZ772_13550 [Cyanobacteria bacterium]|nr:hypothetical protein [Cyanobacteriota bacterium]MDW8202432.1 hypothetical protein [Cyanobacteriota bacterium SKYGB_h_bin112]
MIVAALFRLAYGFRRLLFLHGPNPANDLQFRYNEVQFWFAGKNIYCYLSEGGVYPPASHSILWPFLVDPSWMFVRYLWAFTNILGLIWLIHQLLQASSGLTIAFMMTWLLCYR